MNKYLYFFDKQEEERAQIKVEDVQMLVTSQTSSLASAAGGEASDRVLKFYSNTLGTHGVEEAGEVLCLPQA